MIDTHLHILYGVDDGPETMEESILLAQSLVQEGVYAGIATPHYNDEFQQRTVAEVQERIQSLQQELIRRSISLRLYPGHEALITPGLVEEIRKGNLATLNNSRYLLLELWNSTWLPETDRVIFELQSAGIVPIIAHPERYRAFQKEPNRLAALVERGVLAQLTAGSLVGMQGNTTRKVAENLLKKGLVHCIASDAHGQYKRPPAVVRGLQRAVQIVGRERVHQMTELWPAMIVNNESLNLVQLNSYKRV